MEPVWYVDNKPTGILLFNFAKGHMASKIKEIRNYQEELCLLLIVAILTLSI